MTKRIKKRIAKKRLAEVTATLADGIRVYRKRPREDEELDAISRGILGLNVGMILYWRAVIERHGREGDRWLSDVEVGSVQESGGHLSIAGSAVWSVQERGGEIEQRIPYRMDIPPEDGRFEYTLIGGT